MFREGKRAMEEDGRDREGEKRGIEKGGDGTGL